MNLLVDKYTGSCEGKVDRALFETLPNGESLFLLANGSEGPFTHGYMPIIALVKECVASSLSHSLGSIPSRLSVASSDFEKSLSERFPSSGVIGEQKYSAEFIAAIVDQDRVFFAWIGSQQAKVVRKGQCVRETVPHITVLPGTTRRGFVVTTRFFSTIPGHEEARVETAGPWYVRSGDIIVLADCRLFALGTDDEIGRLVTKAASSMPAKALVAWAEGLENRYAESALVALVR